MHQNEKDCVQSRDEFFQHQQDQCQGVNIWKPQLSARSLFEKQQILELMPVRYRGAEVRTRTPEINYSRMFKKPDSSFPCQKEKKERKREKRTFEGAFVEAGCSGFSGNQEGRCYKVIGVSVKCENKAAVTWAKKWLSIHGLESLIDRSKCQVKQLSQLIWILLKRGWKVTGGMGLLFWIFQDEKTILPCSVQLWLWLTYPSFLSLSLEFLREVLGALHTNFPLDMGAFTLKELFICCVGHPHVAAQSFSWRAWCGTQSINLLVSIELPSSSHLFLLFHQCFCVWGEWRMKVWELW